MPFASPRRTSLLSAIAAPILAFYTILAVHLVNIPFSDDYETVLSFMVQYSRLDAWHRICLIFSFQHNEYKLIFENAIFALQYLLLHRPNFIFLCIIGDLLVLALFAGIWFLLLPTQEIDRKLRLAIPIAFALFQLRYAETLNWSMGALQNISVLIAALFTIGCLVRRRYTLACALFAVTICCSGNGFLLFPVGAWLTWRYRKAFIAWLAILFAMVALYSYHYVHYSLPGAGPEPHSALPAPLRLLLYLNPVFSLSFMGSVIGLHWIISALVGTALLCVVIRMIATRYDRINPTVFYFTIFLVITAICVSTIRSNLGLVWSFIGRYRIYSLLLFICAYLFAMERSRQWYRPALVASILLCILGNVYGHFFYVRQSRYMHSQAVYYTYEMCTLDPEECRLRHRVILSAQQIYRLPADYTKLNQGR
jgi:hypothetical protein